MTEPRMLRRRRAFPAASGAGRAAEAAAGEEQAGSRRWTTLELLRWTKAYFERKGIPSARLEAELLLAEALGCERLRLYLDFERAVPERELGVFRELVRRRGEERIPAAYLLGRAQFLELKLRVTPEVLIPRPETEELAVWALARLKEMAGAELLAADLGAGSGCLALALAQGEPRARVWAVELSPGALAVARGNAAALAEGAAEAAGRVSFLEGDLFAPLPEELRGRLDLLVSNPPYIAQELKAALPPEVRLHEPPLALFAAEDGLAVLRRIAAEADVWLRPGGWLGLELSPEQAWRMRALLEEGRAGKWAEVQIGRDARGLDRFIRARRGESGAEAG